VDAVEACGKRVGPVADLVEDCQVMRNEHDAELMVLADSQEVREHLALVAASYWRARRS
jgi:hypothetical protein